MAGMPTKDREESAKKPSKPAQREVANAKQRAEDGLREQAKTEIEERPYLDTEGGE